MYVKKTQKHESDANPNIVRIYLSQLPTAKIFRSVHRSYILNFAQAVHQQETHLSSDIENSSAMSYTRMLNSSIPFHDHKMQVASHQAWIHHIFT